jgi:hypothetical protein
MILSGYSRLMLKLGTRKCAALNAPKSWLPESGVSSKVGYVTAVGVE